MKVYNKLTIRDRYYIKISIDSLKSLSQIARDLGKHRSVITREVNKNKGKMWYDPVEADINSRKCNKKGHSKIEKNKEIKNYIIKKLELTWSPVAIAGRLNLENKSKVISAETIYQWIYSNMARDLKLYKLLPKKKKRRGFRRFRSEHKNNKPSIKNRPYEIDLRLHLGHFEADLIFQKGNQSANLLTLIDRKSRMCEIIKNKSKAAKTIQQAILNLSEKYDIKSITFDNGSEFANYKELPMDTYFCQPGAPWEKGSIEHLNGMIRNRLDYCKPIETVTQEDLNKIVNKLNNMPRKSLDFLTPKEVYESQFKISENYGGYFCNQ